MIKSSAALNIPNKTLAVFILEDVLDVQTH